MDDGRVQPPPPPPIACSFGLFGKQTQIQMGIFDARKMCKPELINIQSLEFYSHQQNLFPGVRHMFSMRPDQFGA